MKYFKNVLAAIGLVAVLTMSVAYAGAIHTWASGETLAAADLNYALQHIHSNMVGGHGARLVNADVSTTAAIAHSKLATPALLPKAYGTVTNGTFTACSSAGTCTLWSSSQVTSSDRIALGVYSVTLAYTPANTGYAVIVTPRGAKAMCITSSYATAAPQFVVSCYDDTGTAVDRIFDFIVMDNN